MPHTTCEPSLTRRVVDFLLGPCLLTASIFTIIMCFLLLMSEAEQKRIEAVVERALDARGVPSR